MFITHYASLRAAEWPARDEATAFDNHVLASALALALAEAETDGVSVGEGLGLGADEIGSLLDRHFPIVARNAFGLFEMPEPIVDDEEAMLRDLLMAHRAGRTPVTRWLAAIVARRAMRPDHLWQDLGLNDRGELSRLLQRHFPTLHAGNTKNMRWKKYFYRALCEAEGFSLCTAPSCGVCTDFAACFGDEDGMSRLADLRRVATAA